MRIAISLEDELLRAADETAREMGLSRSRLFALAVANFLEIQRREKMLHRLNEIYSNGMDSAEIAVLNGIKAKFGRTLKER